MKDSPMTESVKCQLLDLGLDSTSNLDVCFRLCDDLPYCPACKVVMEGVGYIVFKRDCNWDDLSAEHIVKHGLA